MSLFLDPCKPIATCTGESCSGCSAGETIRCHFTLKDLVHFYALILPIFLVGGAGILRMSGWWLLFWAAGTIGFFVFPAARVLCAHCPHYAEPVTSLKCWANYGVPKLWKYRPGPLSSTEKLIFYGGLIIIWGYPLLFLVMGLQWFLLLLYIVTSTAAYMSLASSFCSACMNLACPFNSVPEDVREEFFKLNPQMAKARGKETIISHVE